MAVVGLFSSLKEAASQIGIRFSVVNLEGLASPKEDGSDKGSPTKVEVQTNFAAAPSSPMLPSEDLESTLLSLIRAPRRTRADKLRARSEPVSPREKRAAVWESVVDLPCLPVPKLKDTQNRFLKSIEPLGLSREEAIQFFESERAVELQNKLLERAKNTDNWLTDLWTAMGYLIPRDSLIVSTNAYFLFRLQKPLEEIDPVRRMARWIRAVLEFSDNVENGEVVEPGMCMSAYKHFFHSCRIPGIEEDRLEIYHDVEDYIVIICNNQFFRVDVLPAMAICTKQLEQMIHHVKKYAFNIPQEEQGAPIGILTSRKRDLWANDVDNIVQLSPENAETVDIIRKSKFMVCIDKEEHTEEWCDIARCAFHGGENNRFNRWYDKPFQFLLFDSGQVGMSYEHSQFDGSPMLRFTAFLCGRLNEWEKIDSDIMEDPSLWEDLEYFHLPIQSNTPLIDSIKSAEEELEVAVQPQTVDRFELDLFGKNFITRKYRVSPDAFVQMCFHLAYYRVEGEFAVAYESALLRRYKRGRTEAIRTLTSESAKFVSSFDDPSVSVQEKNKFLRAACDRHKQVAVEANTGKGIDRHLFGLKCMEDESHPVSRAFFESEAHVTSGSWTLSTTAYTSPNHDVGFPILGFKYGIVYNIFPYAIRCTVGSLDGKEKQFIKTLRYTLKDVYQLCLSVISL